MIRRVIQGSTTSRTIQVEKAGWQTVTPKAKLPAGTQTIHVQLPERRMHINWIEFAR